MILRVLLVEDSVDDAELLEQKLRHGGYELLIHRVETADEMRDALSAASWNLVIADYVLPSFGAMSALRLLQSTGLDLPFIIVSGRIGEDVAVTAMKSGAHDYIMKDNLARLIPAVQRELREAEIRRERDHAERRLRHMAYHDSLTGLPNRTLFIDRLQHAMLEADRRGNLVGVMFLDLDHFKHINDSLGHEAGDLLLRAVAERMSNCVRAVDTVARAGGDEFTVVLTGVTNAEGVSRLAQKILDAFTQAIHIGEHEIYISPSIGIALYPADADNAETLLRNADIAMYRVKQHGRKAYRFFTPDLRSQATQRVTMETALRRAIERDQFVLHYQPQIGLESGAVVGAEALLRWRHPELGLIGPEQFIPMAEETGLILDIGAWVLHTACTQNKAWQDAQFAPLRMAVNFSVRQFHERHLGTTIAEILARCGLDAAYLDLELTESIIMHNVDSAFSTLQQLREMGISISIDDFGTGYSSLSYLKRFPIDAVKLDQTFVRDIATDRNDAAIANAIIVMAHTLELRVVAEGVETGEQLQLLRSQTCDAAQGYHVHRPVPSDDFEHLLKESRPLPH